MKRICITFFLVIASVGTGLAAEAPLGNEGRKGLNAKGIDEMLALPETEVDVGLGALLIAKEYDPNLDVAKHLAELDAMAREVRSRIGDEKDPERIVAAINQYVFTERRYGTLNDDEDIPGVSFLHFLLEHKKGRCVTLSTLYIALGERLNLPFFGVSVPLHLFVRYEVGDTKINVETMNNGARISDPEYISSYCVPETPSGRAFYMRSLSKREVLAILLFQLVNPKGTEGKLDEAVEVCKKVLAVVPNLDEAWVALGNLYADKGQPDNAIEAYNKAIAIDPEFVKAWNRLGLAYEDQKKYSEAVEAYKRAIQIDPEYAEAWLNMGFAYRQIGVPDRQENRFDQAIESYRKALQIDPTLAEAWYALGNVYFYWKNERKTDEAVSAYKKALEIDPDFSEANHDLAFIYYFTGRRRLARELDPDLVASLTSDPGVESTAGRDCFRTVVLLTVASLLFALLEIRLHQRRRMIPPKTTEARTRAE